MPHYVFFFWWGLADSYGVVVSMLLFALSVVRGVATVVASGGRE